MERPSVGEVPPAMATRAILKVLPNLPNRFGHKKIILLLPFFFVLRKARKR
jgi:hypothetical protein